MMTTEILRAFAQANEFKEGDLLIGGTRDDSVRGDAREYISAMSLGEIARADFVEDRMTEALRRSIDRTLAAEIQSLTVADFKRILLAGNAASWVSRYSGALSSESIAAVVKVMADDELGVVARTIFNALPGTGVCIGSEGHFGSRIQPNSPGDDETEILLSILEGLAYVCGDVIIGLNPASDDLDTIVCLEKLLSSVVERLELPTRYSVLSDIVKQTSARERTRVDVGFQSLAGTSRALKGMVGLDVDGVLDLARGFSGLYFETGQGSAVTSDSAEGVDMVTLESRAYGVARLIQKETGSWMIVNDVAGFIGPEVFRSPEQLFRACLEDTVMAKLHGITMGLDVCSTFHMGIDPATLNSLTSRIVKAASPAYLMAVAGNADPMLGYMTTSFREHPGLRRLSGRHPTTRMNRHLASLGVNEDSFGNQDSVASLYSKYMRAGGETRSSDALADEARNKIHALQERGFDLGYGVTDDRTAPEVAAKRMDAIYRNARNALYSVIDRSVVRDASARHVLIRTVASDREEFLSHPKSGERIATADAEGLSRTYPLKRPSIQIVISDGLNANAVNQNLRAVLPALRHGLSQTGWSMGDTDIIIENGRVRAGYHIGALLDVDVIIHLIGERPGTGLDQLSAYITFGRTSTGESRWSYDLDHSLSNAVCGINERAKPPVAAVGEIVRLVQRVFKERNSGVILGKSSEPF